MMQQALFFVGLYVVGLAFGLLFKRRVPMLFITASGFLWGALLWVICALLLLSLSLPYSLTSMAVCIGAVLAGILIGHLVLGTWRISRQDAGWIITAIGSFVPLVVLVLLDNRATISPDSVTQLTFARSIALDGFTAWNTVQLGNWGPFLAVIQSSGTLLGLDYLYGLQPVFGLTFAWTFFAICFRATRDVAESSLLPALISLIMTVLLVGNTSIYYQFFYIHNNFLSAIYLLVAVGGFWLGLRENEDAWLIIGTIALIAFSLMRIEGVIFALVFLVLVVAARKLTYRQRLMVVVPYASVMILWYLRQLTLLQLSIDSNLTPGRTIAFVTVLVLFVIAVALTRYRIIRDILCDYLPPVIVLALLLGVGIAIVVNPAHMLESIAETFHNMLVLSFWGYLWVAVIFFMPLFFVRPYFSQERVFSYGIVSFFLLVFALVVFRGMYRYGWGDSANRMMTHVAPIIGLYYAVKIESLLNPSTVVSDSTQQMSGDGVHNRLAVWQEGVTSRAKALGTAFRRQSWAWPAVIMVSFSITLVPWYLVYTERLPYSPALIVLSVLLALCILLISFRQLPAIHMVDGNLSRYVILVGCLGVLFLLWLVPWQSWLGDSLPWFRMMSSLLAFIMPGAALSLALSRSGESFRLGRVITTGFAVSTALTGLFGLAARGAHVPIRYVELSLLVVGVAGLLGAFMKPGGVRVIVDLTPDLPAMAIPVISVLAFFMLQTAWPEWNPDKLTYSAFLVNWQHAVRLDFHEVFLGAGTTPYSRFWLMHFPLVEAILARLSGIHGLLLITVFFCPPLALLSFIGVYELARSLGLSRRMALLALVGQAGFLILLTNGPYYQAGWTFFVRLAEDKGAAAFVLAPVLFGTVTEYLQDRGWRGLLLILLVAMSMTFTSATILAVSCLIAGLYTLIYVASHQETKNALLAFVPLMIAATPPFALLIYERFFGTGRMFFSVQGRTEAGRLEDIAGTSARGLTVLKNSTFYGFDPRALGLRFPGEEFLSSGMNVGNGMVLALIVAVGVLAIFRLRQSRAAGYMLASSFVLLFALFPYTGWLLGLFITPFHLWRIPWLYPFGIALAFCLVWGYEVLSQYGTHTGIGRKLLGMITERAHNVVIDGVYVLAALIVIVMPPPPTRSEVDDSLYVDLINVGTILDDIEPGRVVVLGGELNDFIPSISARTKVLSYRTQHLMENYGLSPMEAQQRLEDWSLLTTAATPADERIELLREYGVEYLLTEQNETWLQPLLAEYPVCFHLVGEWDGIELYAFNSVE